MYNISGNANFEPERRRRFWTKRPESTTYTWAGTDVAVRMRIMRQGSVELTTFLALTWMNKDRSQNLILSFLLSSKIKRF